MANRRAFPLTGLATWTLALLVAPLAAVVWAQADPAEDLTKAREEYHKAIAGADEAKLAEFARKEWTAAKAKAANAETKARAGDAKAAATLYQQAAKAAKDAIATAAYAETYRNSTAAASAEDAKRRATQAAPLLLKLDKEADAWAARELLVQLEELIPQDPRMPAWRDAVKAMPAPKQTCLYLRVQGQPITPIKLVRIPAGAFTMGSPASEKDRSCDEGPPHEVTISKPFYMSVCEITQAQWDVVNYYEKDPSNPPGNPVVNIGWERAARFAKVLCDARNKRTVRLPTEAEWEYACRAGAATRFSSGDDESSVFEAGWFLTNSERRLHLCGQKKPNAWGLYDMHGNAWEWCSDHYASPYPAGKAVDPQGPAGGYSQIARGGSWRCMPQLARSAYRHILPPLFSADDSGFRIVVTWDPL